MYQNKLFRVLKFLGSTSHIREHSWIDNIYLEDCFLFLEQQGWNPDIIHNCIVILDMVGNYMY